MQAPKNGFFYTLDRVTGEFISPNLIFQLPGHHMSILSRGVQLRLKMRVIRLRIPYLR